MAAIGSQVITYYNEKQTMNSTMDETNGMPDEDDNVERDVHPTN